MRTESEASSVVSERVDELSVEEVAATEVGSAPAPKDSRRSALEEEAERASGGARLRLSGPRWLRGIMLLAGCVSLALGILGIFLPLLPTTPLILLAAICFARGSERAYRWLLEHRMFGRIVSDWEQHRCIPKRAKWTAIALVVVAFSLSALLIEASEIAYAALFLGALVLIIFLTRLPTLPIQGRQNSDFGGEFSGDSAGGRESGTAGESDGEAPSTVTNAE